MGPGPSAVTRRPSARPRRLRRGRPGRGVARNEYGITSSRWYRCVLPNGAAGYLPEVYVAPAYRGGQRLPTCS
jgi:hypothetical protein